MVSWLGLGTVPIFRNGGGGGSFASLKGTQGKETLQALTIGMESKIESQHFFHLISGSVIVYGAIVSWLVMEISPFVGNLGFFSQGKP